MVTKAEYVIEDIVRVVPIGGFVPPTENYSKLPHALINALPLITSLSEMKVILYVLRHTWGYQDDEKRISLDEFSNGRKHTKRYLKRHPGAAPRLDSGTGMSINAIKSGIKRAVEHGFLDVDEDDSDKARIKRWYSLSESDCQELTPDRQELTPRVSEVDPRTKKETQKETYEKEPALPDSPPLTLVGTARQSANVPESITNSAAVVVDDVAETEAMFKEPKPVAPRTAEQHRAGIQRAIQTFEETGGRAGVADPTKDTDGWADKPLRAFCVLVGEEYDTLKPSKRKDWPKQLKEWAEGWGTDRPPTPDETFHCIQGITQSELNWMTFTSPRQNSFQGVMDRMYSRLRNHQPWDMGVKGKGGSSTPRQSNISSDSVVF